MSTETTDTDTANQTPEPAALHPTSDRAGNFHLAVLNSRFE